MKHIRLITAPAAARDYDSTYWIMVNFINAGVALLGIFAMLFETVSYNIGDKTQ